MTTPTNLVELLPCPFCEGIVHRVITVPTKVAHRHSGCILDDQWFDLKAWNTRAALQVIPVDQK